MKLLVFERVYEWRSDTQVLVPVQVPDEIVTYEDVLEWLPTVRDFESCKYLVIDFNSTRVVETLPAMTIKSRWVEGDEA